MQPFTQTTMILHFAIYGTDRWSQLFVPEYIKNTTESNLTFSLLLHLASR